MKSTKKILEPFASRILKVCAEKGKWEGRSLAQELTGCKGYGFDRWLKEMTGHEDFGLHPTNPDPERSSDWFMHAAFMEAHKKRLSVLEAQVAYNERVRAEIAELDKDIRMWEWKILEAKRNPKPIKFDLDIKERRETAKIARRLKLCEVTP